MHPQYASPASTNTRGRNDGTLPRLGQPTGSLISVAVEAIGNESAARESLEAAGAVETVVALQIRETGWHLLDTTKMGFDPTTSVVDAEGRCHDVPNLLIFDGSIWPTSAGVNPTATIVALAMRNVELLIDRRRAQAVAS